jgi:hypothetical protein
MKWIFALAIAALLYCSVAYGQGVLDPQGGRYPDAVEMFGDDSVMQTLSGLPVDDSAQWQVIVFAGPDAASRQLVQDFRTHPQLSQVAAWGHFNVYDYSRRSQHGRFNAYGITRTSQLPVVVVHPPRGSREFPYYYAYRESFAMRYDSGRALSLAKNIVGNVKEFVARHVRARPCPTPDCTPARPQDDRPSVLPALPAIPDVGPVRPKPDTPGLGDFPEWPQITVIYDDAAIGEEITAEALKDIARQVADRFPGVDQAKARAIALSSDAARAFPVDPSDTPAVFVTSRGKILASFNRLALSVLRDVVQLPERFQPPVPGPSVIVAPRDPDTGLLQHLVQHQSQLEEARLAQDADQQSRLRAMLGMLGGGGIGSFVLLGAAGLYVLRRRRQDVPA